MTERSRFLNIRRTLCCWCAIATTVALIAFVSVASAQSTVELASVDRAYENPASAPGNAVLTAKDEKFLDDLEQRGIQFFIDNSNPKTGLMRDRSDARGGREIKQQDDVASIASVGFGLTCFCIASNRGWMPKQEAYDRCLKVIRFLHDHGLQEHGTFYHWVNMETGQREWNSEVSNIDTALLMTGVLTARQYFPKTELAKLATELYDNVDWTWLLRPDGTLSMGWKPEEGMLKAAWTQFNEGPLIYLLGLGSPTHPLPKSSWEAWKRKPVKTFYGLTYLICPPLFTHQYPQCWFDLRGLRDQYADYFRDSQLATIAQRQWMMEDLSKQFPDYGPNMWGLTASDYVNGYTAWGGPPKQGPIDGSVVPAAVAGSLAFEPRLCLDALEYMKQKYGEKAYLKYGFVDAFNPAKMWYNKDVISIDVGPTVLIAENCRSGFVWKLFMSAPEAQAGIKAAGFRALNDQEKQKLSTTSLFFTEESSSGD